MLLPLTVGLPVDTALIMLAGIYYGSQYGGSTTVILINLPGEATSIVTALDGHQMAKQGKAGRALAVAAIGSFIAGTIATLIIVLFAPPLAALAMSFGAPEYFSLMVLGLVATIVLAHGSLFHAFAMVLLGLLLGLVGIDINSGVSRYTMDVPELSDGINFVALAMGMFGIGEIIANLEREECSPPSPCEKGHGAVSHARRLEADHRADPSRNSSLGSVLGILPGGGMLLASFASYALEKNIEESRRVRQGCRRRGSRPGSSQQRRCSDILHSDADARNSGQLRHGPNDRRNDHSRSSTRTRCHDRTADALWGLIASMWLGNLMLVVLNLPLIGLWVRMISVPYHFLFPAIILFCCIGTYSLNNNSFDVYVMTMSGLAGYFLKKLDAKPFPLLLAFILSPMIRGVSSSHADPVRRRPDGAPHQAPQRRSPDRGHLFTDGSLASGGAWRAGRRFYRVGFLLSAPPEVVEPMVAVSWPGCTVNFCCSWCRRRMDGKGDDIGNSACPMPLC